MASIEEIFNTTPSEVECKRTITDHVRQTTEILGELNRNLYELTVILAGPEAIESSSPTPKAECLNDEVICIEDMAETALKQVVSIRKRLGA